MPNRRRSFPTNSRCPLTRVDCMDIAPLVQE
jgi:hypothetical protein